MKLPYQMTGALLILFGAFMTRESFLLRFYTPQGPGPGLLPLLISAAMLLLGIAMFVQATFGTSDPMPADFFPNRAGGFRVAALALASIGLFVLMVPLGFILSTMAFLLFVLIAMGKQKPLIAGVVALIGSFGTYYVFAYLLQVPLPEGVFSI